MEEKKPNDFTPSELNEPVPIVAGNISSKKTSNDKAKNIRTKTTAIIATALSVIICVLLFIDGFFSYESSITYGYTTQSVYKYFGSFSYLSDSVDGGFLFPALIIFASVIIIIASWIKMKRGLKTICSAAAIIVLITGIIVGKNNFHHASSSYLSYLNITTWRNFYSLGILFYIEIVLLIALLVVCFWEDLKIIKTASTTKKEAVTENQATSSKETTTVVQVASPAEEIKKYKELRDSGIISQEEFDSKKKQLLGL